jgi:D-glycero-D-manno-heptose 1,7-bisphosphate phosphatase
VRPAVFIDRDGTLIELVHHLTDPAKVRVLPNAAKALRELRRHGYACVLVSNQSVVGRGLLTLEGLAEVHAELARQLALEDASLDGYYFCPVAPVLKDPTVIEHPDRKPGPGMLLRAAAELELDLAASWMIGDAVSDVLAGRNAGCKASILVRTGYGDEPGAAAHADHVASDFWTATQVVLELDGKKPPATGHGDAS